MNFDALKGNDDRPEVRALFANLKEAAPLLRNLREDCAKLGIYEDGVYRFYHQSFKVYNLQDFTTRIVEALQPLAPDRELHPYFRQIINKGTNFEFEPAHHERWVEATLPIITAFQQATYFLEMALNELDAPPRLMPPGWAALLYLYQLR